MINILCKIDNDEIIDEVYDKTVVYGWREYSKYFNGYFLNSGNYKFLEKLPNFPQESALDIFYLSIFVYYADKAISRDSYFDGWTRDICLHVPVLEIESAEQIQLVLEETLGFLTGDKWNLVFRKRILTHREDFIKRKLNRNRSLFNQGLDNIENICMLSGGLDSFIGASDLLKESNQKTIFVSHHDSGAGELKYQKSIVNLLIDRYNVDDIRFNYFCLTVKNGIELTTRSRSFMFFSHAVLIGSCFNKKVKLYIPENGFIALNVPFVPSRNGSNSTRTTHPMYLENFNKVLKLLDINIEMFNPYKFSTKGEMMLNSKDLDFVTKFSNLTMSCSHPTKNRWAGKTYSGPIHCGNCLPCIIRKASFIKANISDAKYYDNKLNFGEALSNFRVYQNGLFIYDNTDSRVQLLKSGPINSSVKEYVSVYERGMEEVREVIRRITDAQSS